MKLLATITIWVLAVLLAGLLILKLLRGRPVLVRSAVGRRAIRIAALVLVFTGTSGLVGGEAAGQGTEHAPRAEPDDAAAALSEPMPAMLEHYLLRLPDVYAQAMLNQSAGQSIGVGLALQDGQTTYEQAHFSGRALLGLKEQAPHLDRVMRAQLTVFGLEAGDAAAPAEPIDWDTLWSALEEARKPDLLHPAVHTLIWRQAQALSADDEASVTKLAMILDEIESQARVYNTVIAALAQARLAPMRVHQRAWMSKAGPPPPERYIATIEQQHDAIFSAARTLYPQTDAGAWRSEGLLVVRADEASPPITLIRQGRRIEVQPGAAIRLGRLDLIQCGEQGGVLETDLVGELHLPANATLRAGDLPTLLDEDARAAIAEVIHTVLDRPESGLDGNIVAPEEAAAQQAAVQLERHLPLVAPILAEAIREHPEAYGSATLRTLLNQYQLPAEAVDPVRRGEGFERERFAPGREGF